MKKVLIVASVVSFIEWFNKENINFLKEKMGCEVHIACNFEYMEDTDENRTRKYISELNKKNIILHNIEFVRNPLSRYNLIAFRKLKKLIQKEKFDLIHCHTPVASLITRLAACDSRKKGCIVMYTCHGFHFHKNSAKKNWIIYYPIEKQLSKLCDYIITINQEDYNLAKRFHCKNIRYIPGVGVDISTINNISVDKNKLKKEINVPLDAVMVISVGELIERKNHEVIIRALAKTYNPNIYYVIAGKGPLKEKLIKLAYDLGLGDRVIFLGFRTDIFELYHVSDISAFPSKIEGLGLAGIEAMAAGLPLISSNVHGILDYVKNGITGYAISPNNVIGYADALNKLATDKRLRSEMKKNCLVAVDKYGKKEALECMWKIYREIL